MFRRRNPRSYPQIAQDMIYPRGGWSRAGQYMLHRLRRLPDPPHRIGRGVAAGVFASFTPLFGLHFLVAGGLAWAIGGNIFAALLATFVGNPLTFPFIALGAVTLGRWLLGVEGAIGPQAIIAEIARASGEIGGNVVSLITRGTAEWSHLASFWQDIFLPYLIGGTVPGLAFALAAHWLTVPLVQAYQRRRIARAVARARRSAKPDAPPPS